MRKVLAFLMSLVVLGAAVWMPTSAYAQFLPGALGSGGSGGGSAPPFSDTGALVMGGTDPTKLLRFEVDGFTTGTTRVLTPQNNDYIVAGTNIENTFSARQMLTADAGIYLDNAQAVTNPFLSDATGQTPDTAALGVSTTSRTFVLLENGDQSTDGQNGPCAGAACTHPTLLVYGATPTATSYTAVSYGGLMRRALKSLTESAATSVTQVPIAAGSGAGGTFHYTVFAADGTDQQVRSGFIRFAVSNKAGTETCGMTNNSGAADASITETEDGNAVSISAGTLTYAITCVTTPTNAVDFQINAVSSLTQTALDAYGSVDLVGPGQILPQ